MSACVLRLLPSHAMAYRTLMLQAYAEHPEAFTSSAAERAALLLAWWEARLSPADTAGEVVFGAMLDSQLIGAAGLSFEKREKARHKANLFGMVVNAAAQGRGLGQQLVNAVLAHARAQPGLRLVQLTVTEGNLAAENLYLRCGFVRFGVEPMAVRVDKGYVDKVHMWCDLRRG